MDMTDAESPEDLRAIFDYSFCDVSAKLVLKAFREDGATRAISGRER